MNLPKSGDTWVRPDGVTAEIVSVNPSHVTYKVDGVSVTVSHAMYFELAQATVENGGKFVPKKGGTLFDIDEVSPLDDFEV